MTAGGGMTEVADALRLLDLRIRRRLTTAVLLNDLSPRSQTARTVYISREEVDWLLTAEEPQVAEHALDLEIAQLPSPPLPGFAHRFKLSYVEAFAVVVCLAPELRRKYDRLYAYLQDDITRKRPSVDLILDLLGVDEDERWRLASRFDDEAPLLRTGILRALPDPASPSGSSGLARFLTLDPRIRRHLLGDDTSAARETPIEGSDAAVPIAQLVVRSGPVLAVALHGPGGDDLARQVCAELGLDMVMVEHPVEDIRLAVREAALKPAAVCVTGADELAADDSRATRAALAAALEDLGGLVFLVGERPWSGGPPLGSVPVHDFAVPMPDPGQAAELWRRALPGRPEAWADELAGRFRLTPAAIRAAVDSAERCGPLTLPGVYAACRARSAGRLADLALAIRPAATWDDLVLPADRTEQLRDICAQVRHHHHVYTQWGFARGNRGTGLTALFAGPSGTGKTMAAEVLAGDLGLDLYKVDLSGVVSKYIGETEKNLRRVFGEARDSNAILFFDEADALFGRRTEVSDAHDRYANIETSYLLQEMERYDGVVVLATNLRQNMDEAFTRRLRFVVEFPFPDADSRARIWRTHLPSTAPIAPDVDVTALAKAFDVAGGTIRNIVLNAAFRAAADGGVIDRRHVLHGTRREFDKIGRMWTDG